MQNSSHRRASRQVGIQQNPYCSAQCPIISVNTNPYRGYCVPAHSARTTRAFPTYLLSSQHKTSTLEPMVRTSTSAKETAFTDIFRRAQQTKLRAIRVLPTQLKRYSQPNAYFFAAFLPAAWPNLL